ncbi:MAG: hypothetical protein RSB38_09175 [Oscillospiraceae bacterium]
MIDNSVLSVSASSVAASSAASDVVIPEPAVSETVGPLVVSSAPTTQETVQTVPQYDSWLNVPLDDYTVTEGLLLLLVAAVVCSIIWAILKEVFSW